MDIDSISVEVAPLTQRTCDPRKKYLSQNPAHVLPSTVINTVIGDDYNITACTKLNIYGDTCQNNDSCPSINTRSIHVQTDWHIDAIVIIPESWMTNLSVRHDSHTNSYDDSIHVASVQSDVSDAIWHVPQVLALHVTDDTEIRQSDKNQDVIHDRCVPKILSSTAPSLHSMSTQSDSKALLADIHLGSTLTRIDTRGPECTKYPQDLSCIPTHTVTSYSHFDSIKDISALGRSDTARLDPVLGSTANDTSIPYDNTFTNTHSGILQLKYSPVSKVERKITKVDGNIHQSCCNILPANEIRSPFPPSSPSQSCSLSSNNKYNYHYSKASTSIPTQVASQFCESPKKIVQRISPLSCSNTEITLLSRNTETKLVNSESSDKISQSSDAYKRECKPETSAKIHKAKPFICQVCSDAAPGFHCGAYVCEACKKFFVRSMKSDNNVRAQCLKDGHCSITKETRTNCQACRLVKCHQVGMMKTGSGSEKKASVTNSIPCRVCAAPSSGFHFGAITCEGCKGFFRRSTKDQSSGTYRCSNKGLCQISRQRRTMCKACRYEMCLRVGMCVTGSRVGRQSNSFKHATMLEVQRTTPATTKLDSDISISDADYKETVEGIDIAWVTMQTTITTSLEVQLLDHLYEHEQACMDNMMKVFEGNAHAVLKFSKSIKGFRKLEMADQIHLIKETMYQIVQTCFIKQYDIKTDFFSYFGYSDTVRNKILHHFPDFGRVLVSHFHTLGHAVCSLNLDNVEYGLLCGLQLFNSESTDLADKASVEDLQRKFTAILKQYVKEKHGPYNRRNDELLSRLPILQQLTAEHNLMFINLLQNRPNVNFHPLFLEVFLNENIGT